MTDERGSGHSGPTYEYDVAVTFAGEQRVFVEAVVECLTDLGVHVFYDANLQHELLGRDGIEVFSEMYLSQAFRVLMFTSHDYVRKAWPNVERRAAIARSSTAPGSDHIVPIRMDDADVPGVLPTTIGLDARISDSYEIAHEVLKHLVSVGRLDESYLAKVSRSLEQARLVSFHSLVGEEGMGGHMVEYRIFNGTEVTIDGVAVVFVDPNGSLDDTNPQNGETLLELVVGPIGAGQLVEGSQIIRYSEEPMFGMLHDLAVLLWSDYEGHHWVASGTDTRRRGSRARTC